MSFNALVIPEDPENNGYILKPLVIRMLEATGRPNPQVDVLANPRTRGYEHAKGLLRSSLMERYRHKDLLLFLVDADGKDRRGEFEALEKEAVDQRVRLLCCAALQEVEVWLMAGHRQKLGESWATVRSEISLKERFFFPFLRRHGNARAAGGGREQLMKDTLMNYAGLLRLCPELEELERRLR